MLTSSLLLVTTKRQALITVRLHWPEAKTFNQAQLIESYLRLSHNNPPRVRVALVPWYHSLHFNDEFRGPRLDFVIFCHTLVMTLNFKIARLSMVTQQRKFSMHMWC